VGAVSERPGPASEHNHALVQMFTDRVIETEIHQNALASRSRVLGHLHRVRLVGSGRGRLVVQE
jgi:hypothetical protein